MSRATDPHRTLRDRTLQIPIATILSAAMLLRYSFDLDQDAAADAIEAAVRQVLTDGYRTGRHHVRGLHAGGHGGDGSTDRRADPVVPRS